MNTQQAYIEGFVKRALEYGLNENEAVNLLKSAMDSVETQPVNQPGIEFKTTAPGLNPGPTTPPQSKRRLGGTIKPPSMTGAILG